jgi:hypothetical protein
MRDEEVYKEHVCGYYCDEAANVHTVMVLIDDETISLEEQIAFFNWLYFHDTVVDLRPAREADVGDILAHADSAWLNYEQVPVEYTTQKPYILLLRLDDK